MARFLTAEWRHLVMMNWPIDPVLLDGRVPPGTELDAFDGRTYLSLVGFLFLRTRVLSIPIPFHRSFEEVNLRFYVRRKAEDDWRRGVVFVKEIVPRWAVAWTARTVYGENYVALPMQHRSTPDEVAYGWRIEGDWCELGVRISGAPSLPPEGSEERFITEHYWGYAARAGGGLEYRVEHPPWKVWRGSQASLSGPIRACYGEAFAEVMAAPPRTVFVADGSPVVVHRGVRLA